LQLGLRMNSQKVSKVFQPNFAFRIKLYIVLFIPYPDHQILLRQVFILLYTQAKSLP
jgi:hypothetical protein